MAPTSLIRPEVPFNVFMASASTAIAECTVMKEERLLTAAMTCLLNDAGTCSPFREIILAISLCFFVTSIILKRVGVSLITETDSSKKSFKSLTRNRFSNFSTNSSGSPLTNSTEISGDSSRKSNGCPTIAGKVCLRSKRYVTF